MGPTSVAMPTPLPRWPGRKHFDLVVSNFVLNDVPDYKGFIATLGSVTRVGGRLVLAMNNPSSAVHREKVEHYFDSGTSIVYAGIKVFYYHRTMEDFIEAFRESRFLLRRLSDVCPTEETLRADPATPGSTKEVWTDSICTAGLVAQADAADEGAGGGVAGDLQVEEIETGRGHRAGVAAAIPG